MRVSNNIKIFLEDLDYNGVECRNAGGCVRDHLLNIKPMDIDVCTPALPQKVMEVAEKLGYKVIPTGLDHGTVTAIVGDEKVEITTLRIDKETDGRHAVVEFTDSWELDASRRDLTVNAMMMDINGKLYDWFGGKQDLENGIIKFVGDAEERVQEDYLRILRFYRFASKFDYGFWYNPEGIDACIKYKDKLSEISGERIWSEMTKIASSPIARYILFDMQKDGILSEIDFVQYQDNVAILDYKGIKIFAISGFDIDKIQERCKISNDEFNYLKYIQKMYNEIKLYRDVSIVIKTLEHELVDGANLEWVLDICDCFDPLMGYKDYFRKFTTIHVFPLTGDDLISLGLTPGKEFGMILKSLKELWKASNYTHTKESLLKLIF